MTVYHPFEDFFGRRIQPSHARMTELGDQAQEFLDNCRESSSSDCTETGIRNFIKEIELRNTELDKSNVNFMSDVRRVQVCYKKRCEWTEYLIPFYLHCNFTV